MYRHAWALRPGNGGLYQCFRTHPVAGNAYRSGLRVLRALRTAKPEDLPEMLVIAQEAKCTWTAADIEAELSLQQSTFLVSQSSEGISGMAVGWHVGGEVQVLLVAVATCSRRKGVGRALVSELLDRAERRDDDMAILEVRVSNAAARGLYESLGFSVKGRRRAYYDNGEDALLYYKDLLTKKVASSAMLCDEQH